MSVSERVDCIESVNIELETTKDNLSKSERLALSQPVSQLLSKTDLIIKESDKGGTTVLMTKSYYKQMVHNHLQILALMKCYQRI